MVEKALEGLRAHFISSTETGSSSCREKKLQPIFTRLNAAKTNNMNILLEHLSELGDRCVDGFFLQ